MLLVAVYANICQQHVKSKFLLCTYCFAFDEGHSLNLVLHLFSELFFDSSPGITQGVHLLGTHQLHGGVTLEQHAGRQYKLAQQIHNKSMWKTNSTHKRCPIKSAQ